MAIVATHKESTFGIGDTVRVAQKINEGSKTRTQIFEGMVISISGHGAGKSFTVRRIGSAQVGIEKIFPIQTPTIEEVKVVKKGGRGARKAKLYFTRSKSAKEIGKIYSRTNRRRAYSNEPKKNKIISAKNSKTTSGDKSGKSGKKNSSN